ncbi:peptidase S8/S53 domain-containing protein [Xylariales sp. PMI_506]|nr:peptidase S8/S53 domain-containing protein [Xylariales sp. PMI_506]
MRVSAWILTGACLSSLATAQNIPDTHVVHERRDLRAPGALRKRSKPDEQFWMPMRIGLKQNNLDSAAQWLMDVAHPESNKYGKHWTSDEVIEAFKPSNETVDAVTQWLKEHGIAEGRITHTDNKVWLAFEASIQEAEGLLHSEFLVHENKKGQIIADCESYAIPKHLAEHIDYITPGVKGVDVTSRLRRRSAEKRSSTTHRRPSKLKTLTVEATDDDLSTCSQMITPACLQALYQFEALNATTPVSPNNSLGIFEEGDYYAQTDLNLFYTRFTPDIPGGWGPKLNSIDGGVAPVASALAGGESNLDFQLAIPIIFPQNTTVYQTDDRYYAEGVYRNATGILNTFLDAIDGSYCTYCAFGECGNDPVLDPTYPDALTGGYNGTLMCGVYQPANVISISYGEQESDLPVYYQRRQCIEFLKLGLRGVSVFVASGDTGVGGIPGDGSTDGCLGDGTVFSPTQPNSCPWLTNVGATMIVSGKAVTDAESAAEDAPPAGYPAYEGYYSGGGFSNIFDVPPYQASAVSTYYETAQPSYPYYVNGSYANSTGLYNRNGRGIPDVSANGMNIAVYLGGRLGLEAGTSAASPIFASLVTRINEERLAAGKSAVGFVNPVLYEHPEVLNDIVNGSNPGCGTTGFNASTGWDPVTGLGTPNYPKMLDLFLSLP